MRYHIIAVGLLKRSFYADACQHYVQRLQGYARVRLTEVKEAKGKDLETSKQQESQALLQAASDYAIALDEQGKHYRSAELAKHIDQLELRGISSISLLIGGANGHSDDLKRQVKERWSLSALTLPHDLARLVLLEQLYRLETIRAGHPYHRD